MGKKLLIICPILQFKTSSFTKKLKLNLELDIKLGDNKMRNCNSFFTRNYLQEVSLACLFFRIGKIYLILLCNLL
jgi:hypothetical protein